MSPIMSVQKGIALAFIFEYMSFFDLKNLKNSSFEIVFVERKILRNIETEKKAYYRIYGTLSILAIETIKEFEQLGAKKNSSRELSSEHLKKPNNSNEFP